MFDFEKLKVYQKSVNYANNVYEITKNFPKSEIFGITSQFRRAAVSVSLNIAEGTGRMHSKERQQFYQIAKALTYECIPIIEICKKQKYITEKIHKDFYSESLEISRMLIGLINSITQ